MACYRNGGCGPYEGRSCSECPASSPEYETLRNLRAKARELDEETKNALDEYLTKKQPIKIKVFLNEGGIGCVMKDSNIPIEIEFIDAVAVENDRRDCGEFNESDDVVDAYINQLCADGFVYVDEEDFVVTNNI